MPAENPFNILINAKSGTVLNMGQAAIESAIETSNLPVAELCFSDPEDMQTHLERFSKAKDPLLIGGGDGTIRETAKYLSTHSKKPFGVLPFGTMNLLAQDLDITTLQSALAAYAAGVREEDVDAGYVNGELFLCCASVGTMPEASVFREQNREQGSLLLMPRMFWFVFESLDRHKQERVVLQIDGKMRKFRTPAVVVSNNRFKTTTKLTESNFKRATLTGGKLAAYIQTTKTRLAHLRFLTRLLIGNWKQDPDLEELTGKHMTLWSKHKKDLVSIDGEVEEMRTPLDFVIKPKSIKLLVPAEPSVPK
ncbi:diacylglycerol kinase [Asticcacaulis sp. AC460]|uniref:diacylglycerol/lipid kinase family protein n=1 Tax=Asticcacaulis sp. AC460 TaxID=1282360 RepID=UPI0003C3B275|nr:diacylglycerol kinase family protein [Asticcacaulis sp. AC460]ESQ90584.1 diacylglycerol kinase [Asticcacaulis sp. AC460]